MKSEQTLNAHLVVARNGFKLDVALRIEPGETVALLGPNGAGKSTAVAALAGLLPLDDGRITLGERVLDDPLQGLFVPPEGRQVGVVFQDYVLFPHLTVAENVAFGLRSRQESARTAGEVGVDWMERFGLMGLAERKARDLSGGQAQKVALARALATQPDLLLLDEPMAALDATSRAERRRDLVDHLEAFPGPRLLITHDPTEAFLLANEIHVIEDGVITQLGSADDIRLRPRTSYVADLAGSNLVVGNAVAGVVTIEGHELRVANSGIAGPVLATIHPRAISVHRERPEGSPRNAWKTMIALVEDHGDRVRLQTGDPLRLAVEVTADAVAALGLAVGSVVWVSIKATEIGVEPG